MYNVQCFVHYHYLTFLRAIHYVTKGLKKYNTWKRFDGEKLLNTIESLDISE